MIVNYIVTWRYNTYVAEPSIGIGILSYDTEKNSYSLTEGNPPLYNCLDAPTMYYDGKRLFLIWFDTGNTMHYGYYNDGDVLKKMNFTYIGSHNINTQTSPSILFKEEYGVIYAFFQSLSGMHQAIFNKDTLNWVDGSAVGSHLIRGGLTSFEFNGGTWIAWSGVGDNLHAGLAIHLKNHNKNALLYNGIMHGGFQVSGQTTSFISSLSVHNQVDGKSQGQVYIFHQEDGKVHWNLYKIKGNTDSELERITGTTLENLSEIEEGTGVDIAVAPGLNYTCVYNKSGKLNVAKLSTSSFKNTDCVQEVGGKDFGIIGTPKIISALN